MEDINKKNINKGDNTEKSEILKIIEEKRKKYNFDNPEEVHFTKDERKMGEVIVGVKKEMDEKKQEMEKKEEHGLLNPLDNKVLDKDNLIMLVGTPKEKAPFASVLMGTLNNGEVDLNLLEFILNKWGVNTVKTDLFRVGKILEGGNDREKSLIKKGNYFIASLPSMQEEQLYSVLDNNKMKHINSDAFLKAGDLYYTYQIFEKIGANQPKTVFLETNEIFNKTGGDGNYVDFSKLIDGKIIKGDMELISSENPVFIRSGKASFKNIDKNAIRENESFNIIKNIFRIIGSKALSKVKEVSFMKLLSAKKEGKDLTEAELREETLSEIRSKGYIETLDLLKEKGKHINKYEKDLEKLTQESTFKAGSLQGIKDFKFDNNKDLINFLNKNLLHIISAGLLTETGIALREFIEIESFEEGEAKFQIPLSKDYRCIVNNGELMNVTTWTPYNAVDNFDNTILGKLKLTEKEIEEIKRVAKGFSKESGLKSFTLDVMKGKDGKLYFYEINRLEHSHMSHSKTRIILAYENACRLAGKEINKEELNSFISVFKDKENFKKVFYGDYFNLLDSLIVQNENFKGLKDSHVKSMESDFNDFNDFDVIWNKYS